jgi:hypothetical protein
MIELGLLTLDANCSVDMSKYLLSRHTHCDIWNEVTSIYAISKLTLAYISLTSSPVHNIFETKHRHR